MPEVCEGDIVQMARTVKSLFSKYKRQQQPQWKPTAPRFNRVWEKAARIVLAEGIDPEKYVLAQFREISWPYPNALSNKSGAMGRYHKYMKESTEGGRAGIIVDSQMSLIMGRLRNGFDMRKVLVDPNESIKPLFRYVAAIVFEYHDLASRFRDIAIEYAKANPELTAVVKKRFPEVIECQQL